MNRTALTITLLVLTCVGLAAVLSHSFGECQALSARLTELENRQALVEDFTAQNMAQAFEVTAGISRDLELTKTAIAHFNP